MNEKISALKKECNHTQFKCSNCELIGCKENDCNNHLVLDSCNPYNSNFEHGEDRCLKCRFEGNSNFILVQ